MKSASLSQMTREWRARGAVSLVRRGCMKLAGTAWATCTVRGKTFADNASLLDFANTIGAGVIQPYQTREEIIGLLDVMRERRPRNVLEIGTARGGTLFLWTRVAAPDAHLISVDLPAGPWGGGYPRWKIPLYRSFALPGQRIDLIRADSHAPATLQKVGELLGENQQVDFLFIDGDHSYAGVKRDHEMYRPLVRPGGLIVFHDIKPQEDPTCQVHLFWREAKADKPHKELVYGPENLYGIGVIFA